MSRKLPAALPAALAVLAVAAPVAGATTRTQSVSGVGTVTITTATDATTFKIAPQAGDVTASGFKPVVFVDTDGPAQAASRLALLADDGGASLKAVTTPGSTTDCQEYAGTDVTPAAGVAGAVAPDHGSVTFTVPKTKTGLADPSDFRWAAFNTSARDADNTCGPSDNSLQGVALSLLTGGYHFLADVAPAAPAAPAGLTAVVGDGKITLSWSPVSDVAGYSVLVNGTEKALTADHAYTVTGLTNGTPYAFQVKAYRDWSDGRVFGPLTAALSATPSAPAPVNPPPVVTPPVVTPPVVTPPVVTPPVVTPPVVTPPVVTPPKHGKNDPDGDGIRNDWLVHGKPHAAPHTPRLGRVGAHTVVLQLPKAGKGVRVRIFVRRAVAAKASAPAFKSVATTRAHSVKLRGLKAHTRYEIKLALVNKAGKQSRASKGVKVRTKRH